MFSQLSNLHNKVMVSVKIKAKRVSVNLKKKLLKPVLIFFQ